MPEIKNQFTGGKMNKDVDERLVPKGEYRDAMNIQVSTSEGSDVGTVQNILGNSFIPLQSSVNISNGKTLGSVADEKNDTFYYLVLDIDKDGYEIGYIFACNGQVSTHVFVDKPATPNTTGVLGFTSNTVITGINVIDDMLFWTDGKTEPKKINIPRSILGTSAAGLTHTRLINPDQNINFGSAIDITEEHITVIKKAPLTAPHLNMVAQREGVKFTIVSLDFSGKANGDLVDLTVTDPVVWRTGDIILIEEGQVTPPLSVYKVRVLIESINGNVFTCSILSIDDIIGAGVLDYSCELDESYEKLYKLKFSRFAIRYKYQDNEYSSFGPFSEVAFVPGPWDELAEKVSWKPNTGYNLGMENKLRELTLQNIIPVDLPKNVKQVDILYKESDSPAVYLVDEIKQNDSYWSSNSYLVEQENIKSILPENQLLRPWDNVPKKALAQDITGSRLVYGNYEQNYDLGNFRGNFSVGIKDRAEVTMKSIKSLREYQVGVIYTDTYNRQTPVLTDTTGSLSVSKIDSSKSSQIEITPNHTPPSWATHHKFYIKETSSEYYNLSLDRHWNAEDGNIWLSFASNDRDKIDLETTLYLKKRFNSNVAETTFEKYKVIDVQNEAPEFVKTRIATLGHGYNNTTHDLSNAVSQVFTGTGNMPVEGEQEIKVACVSLENTLLDNFHKRHNAPDNDSSESAGGGALVNNPIFIRIRFADNNSPYDFNDYETNWYEVDNVSKQNNGNSYIIRLKEPFGGDALWTNNDLGLSNNIASSLISTSKTGLAGSLVFEVGQQIVQNKSVFQGRFFVKILSDSYVEEAIVGAGRFTNTQVIATADCGYLKDFTQEDIFSSSPSAQSHPTFSHDKVGYAAAIADFLTNGPTDPSGNPSTNYTNPQPENLTKPVPLDSYWGHSVWQKISEKLDSKESRWVIDECFATGEEPNYLGANTSQETDFFNFGGKSIFYGGYHSQSTNSSTVDHNSTAIGAVVQSAQSRRGLGNAQPANLVTTPYQHYTDFEYHSIGGGVDTVNNTIDISYIGCGKIVGGDVNLQYEASDASTLTPFNILGSIVGGGGETQWAEYFKIDSNGLGVAAVGGDDISEKAQEFADNLVTGNFIRFQKDPNEIVYEIKFVKKFYKWNYAGNSYDWEYPFAPQQSDIFDSFSGGLEGLGHYYNRAYFNRRITFRITLEAYNNPGAPIGTDGAQGIGYDPLVNPDNTQATSAFSSTNTCPIEIITVNYLKDEEVPFPDNPAIFETEPKDDQDLDIYHEATDTIPLDFNVDTYAPVGSTITNNNGDSIQVVSWGVAPFDDTVQFSALHNFNPASSPGDLLYFLRPDGSYTSLVIVQVTGFTSLKMDIANIQNNPVGLGWNNCYSFGNGVESNRIRDTFNSPVIDKGPKVSTVLAEGYEQENRKYGLIYSGLYNSTSGVNNLNQFIQAEKITKDLNPIYGSIQKLYSGWGQGGDLVALCEDRVLKILANKDALFNADGNVNVTSTNNVLGQAIPYSGEHGISKNPESFASEAYRIYFTDKVRGTVMRLSMDGLTPISNHGMKDWFRDNLKLGDKLIGSYDDKKDEYNITIKSNTTAKTVTFKEDVKGWVSFKSFTPENAISCANEYYTFKNGNIWKHHDETVDRNTFYGTDPQNYTNSSIEVIFNEVPGSVKSFKTVNYEGSQAKVTSKDEDGVTLMDGEYFNLSDVEGWHVTNVITNLERGGITEFIKKEGKWFGYVVGDDVNVSALGNISSTSNYDTEDFSIQGVGSTASVQSSIVFGCMDTAAFNYIPAATNDDGSCIDVVMGCIDPIASNTNGNANTDDGTCIYPGCTIPLATVANEILGGGSLNFDPNANFDDGSCDMATYGCTLAGYFNSNIFADLGSSILETAGTFCGSENCMCIPINYGCTDGGTPATNYLTPNDELTDVNTDDGSCIYVGCTDPNSVDYDFTGSNPAVDGPNLNFTYLNGTAVDDGSCTYIGGCTDATACNYDVNATQDDGSCYFCGDSHAVNYDAATVDYTCVATCEYCEDVASVTITSQTTSDPGISNGTITVEFPVTSFGTQYEVYIPGISSSGFFTPSGNATESYTFIGLPVGTYTIYVSTLCGGLMAGNQLPGGNFGAGPYFGTSVSATITATPVIGCIDDGSTYTGGVVNPAGGTWGACNYDATANADASGVIGGTDYSNCNYTDCVGCDDPLYIEYCGDCWDSVNFVNGLSGSGYGPWVSDTVPTSCLTLIVSGCTDATAYNYNPSATTDDGSCVPVVYGCMDTTLNNDGSYAASNYSGPTVGSANSPCDAAGTGLGTAPGECCADYNCPYNVGISISPGSTSFVFQAETFTTPYFFGPGSNITKSFTITSASLGSNTTTGFSSYNNITNQSGEITGREFLKNIAANITTGLDTSVTVDFDITTNDGNCSVSASQTFSIGCTDANADSFGSFDITDNTQCNYTGCMNPIACNYETYYTVADNASCLYCGDPAAYNYDGAGGSCTGLCFYTGCMDDTPQADGSGYAASNYITTNPTNTLPCNTTGVTGDVGYDPSLDNGCCTYNTAPGVEFSILFGELPQVYYDTTDTGYTQGSMSTITIGSGGNTLTHAGVSQASMDATTSSRIGMTYQNNSNTTAPAYGWYSYVNNGQLDISVTNAVFNGTCDNPSINNQLPTGYASNSVSWSVGCRNDNTAVNYDNTLDLHLQSICEAPNPGCQDSTAITSAQATIIGTNSRFGYSADYNQSCAGPSLGSANAADCCCYTCNNATWQSVPVSSITFDAATSPTFATQFNLNWDPVSTASTYELTHNGSGTFASLTITPTITNGVATYTFFNTSPTRFEHGSTYTFKIKANCVNIDGNSCGSSHEETVTQEFNCSC